MTRAVKVNISGSIFHIDENAYDTLQNYLNNIERSFVNKEDGKEIIADIESRIAELFAEKLRFGKQVITLDDVREVIKMMGNPDEINDEEVSSGHKYRFEFRPRYPRKMYRDPNNSLISGVCGGIGAYFNMDPVLFRLLFVISLFFGGIGFLVYLIFWVAMPIAKTPRQKAEMRGEPFND